MTLYRYDALDLSGKRVKGTTDAGTPAEARAALRERGLHASSLELAIAIMAQGKNMDGLTTRKAGRKATTGLLFSGRRITQLADFSRHLAMLLRAGLPLAQALEVLTEQVEDARFRDVVTDLAVRVREGDSLDEALAVHPNRFPDLFICVARAGAASGELAEVLGDVATFYGRQKKLHDQVVSALTYPALMAAIGGCDLSVVSDGLRRFTF